VIDWIRCFAAKIGEFAGMATDGVVTDILLLCCRRGGEEGLVVSEGKGESALTLEGKAKGAASESRICHPKPDRLERFWGSLLRRDFGAPDSPLAFVGDDDDDLLLCFRDQ